MNAKDRARLKKLLEFVKKKATESYTSYPSNAFEASIEDAREAGMHSTAEDIRYKIEELFPEFKEGK